MPITIGWYDDTKHIVLWEFEGQWTLDDLHQTYTKSHNMCLEVPEHRVIGLLDVTSSSVNSIPSHIFSALNGRARSNAPNYDMTVIASNSTLVKVFVNILNKMPALRDRFMLVASREAALNFIQNRLAEQAVHTV